MTEEEYLLIERRAETKSEFYNGRMYAMAGSSPNHALLTNSIGAILRSQVPPGCRAFSPDLRIKVAPSGLFTYPDCSVVCTWSTTPNRKTEAGFFVITQAPMLPS